MLDYTRQAKLLKTLMHPVRLAILDTLVRDEACVCHLEAVLQQRQAYISQQLMVLREAGLIDMRREGWNVYYRLVEPRILPVLAATRAAVGEGPSARPAVAAKCACPKCTTGRSAWKDEVSTLPAAAAKE